MLKFTKSTVIASVALFVASLIIPQETALAAEETPDYTVVSVHDDIEIRNYPSMILASVTVSGDRSEAANKAFRILAGFIFGDNQSSDKIAMTAPVTQAPVGPNEAGDGNSEKIAMTAPVTQAATGDGQWRVDFMMPSQYTLETLPRPDDPRIEITQTQPYRAVAIRFTGRWTQSRLGKYQAELDGFMTAQGLTPMGPAQYAFYNGPFTPFFLRRNEIIYKLTVAPANE